MLLVIAAMMAASTIPIFVRYREQSEQAVSRVVRAASALMPASDSEDEDESWDDEDWNKALEEAEKMAEEANSTPPRSRRGNLGNLLIAHPTRNEVDPRRHSRVASRFRLIPRDRW